MRSQSNEIVLENSDFMPLKENNYSDNDFTALEEVNSRQDFKKISLSDIVTIQCILCIILAIMAVTANIFLPKITEDIINEYNSINSPEEKINSEIISFVSGLKDKISTDAEN